MINTDLGYYIWQVALANDAITEFNLRRHFVDSLPCFSIMR